MSFPRYPKYKPSGVEWLGEVPEHWVICAPKRRIQSLAGGTLIKGACADEPSDDLFPGFSASGQNIWLEEYAYDCPAIVLSAVGARCGKAFKADGKWGVVANTHCLFPRAETNRDFLWYLTNQEDWWEKGGSAQPFVKVSETLARPWVFPPLPEQTAIAEFLDRETGKIDELVAEQRRLMELLKEKRQAVICHAVTKGLNPHAPMKPSGIEWLGDVPVGWAVLKLGIIARFKGGAGFPDSYQGQTENDFPFFKVGDMVNSDDFRVMRRANHTITEDTAKELRAFIFPARTIVFAKVGAALLLKRYRLLGQRSCIDNNMMGMSLGAAASVDFMLYVLPLLDLDLIVNPGAVPSINEGQISGQRIALPPIEEQREIVAWLDTELAKFDTLTAEAQRAIDLLQERRTALISAAVTGQIDVRQPPKN